MRRLVKTFKALSDPNRIRILKMLEERELCVCEITEILRLAASTVSKHLSLLRDADFILDRKDGKWVYYRLNDIQGGTYISNLLPLLKSALPSNQIILEDREKVRKLNRETMCHI